MKRATWKDRPKNSLRYKLDFVTKGGSRYVVELFGDRTPRKTVASIIEHCVNVFGPVAVIQGNKTGMARGLANLKRAARKRESRLRAEREA